MPSTPTQLDIRQSVLRSALNMAGTAANASVDNVLISHDAELAKLFEDRNIFLTQGGSLTFTGTQIQFTEALNIVLNSRVAGGTPQIISLGSTTQTFNAGDLWYAVINRTAGTATTAVVSSTTGLPTVASTNQEVFLIATRIDAADGTQRLYFRNGMAINSGQTVRLGASGSGSGSGSGTGDDLDALLFRASFSDTFQENSANANSSILTSGTNAAFNAAKNMYTINYDATKNVTGTGVNMTLTSAPSFTVVAGDSLIVNNQSRKIITVTSQTVYVLEGSFTLNPTAAAATVSQTVYTKDIYNFAADGAALSSGFGTTSFVDILVDYKDNSTVGGNIFVPNTTPVVGFSASPDNINFTSVFTRATNESDVAQSTALPVAGTALYMRFFANKSSGSGIVNLITYKAFMQKTLSATSGGIINSSYAFTNGVGTPINSSISVVGGKTTITLIWQYAIGVLSGTTASSIEVWLNGQKLPRFVNSILTPDGSFSETSSSIITLDRDYSSLNLAVEIFQRTQIIDSSTINTTNISYLQEINQNGFQSFIAQNQLMNPTLTAGAPSAGSFYTSVINRASIVDFNQDLKPRMALERIQTQQAVQSQTEFGPNGETVFSAVNDQFGQIRFVGSWITLSSSYGAFVQSTSVNDYTEITFFGTGLNLLTFATAYDVRVSVDGGAEGVNIYATSSQGILGARNYAANQVLTAASGLTLGVHTVKLRTNTVNIPFYGFEVLNSSANVITNPGISYINGQKLVLASQSSIPYANVVTGIRGGRILHYQNANGTIGQSFQAVNAASATLASTDHTNEEVVRTYSWREFGAGRADDFSGNFSAGSNLAFTLDDSTTSLVGNSVSNGNEGIGPGANGAYVTVNFVGTGLDIERTDDATGGADNYTMSIDGGTAVTYASSGSTVRRTTKLVSGLPYGTHTVRFTRVTAVSFTPRIYKFIVYQPKKPTLPSGAVELADYNVMATYVANTTVGTLTIGTGVLRKSPVREVVYVGTGWSAGFPDTVNDPTGWRVESNVVGDYAEYVFFGTGVDYRFYGLNVNGTTSATITVDGSSNLSGFTTSSYGAASFTPATGVFSQAATNAGAGISISGLTLGLHKIRVTNNSTNYLRISGFDIVTPINSAKSNVSADNQNTLPVGSQGISDNRKLTILKDLSVQTKNSAQAIGVASNPTTTSTTFVPMPDMSTTIKVSGNKIRISYSVSFSGSAVNIYSQAVIYVDGIQVGMPKGNQAYAAGANGSVADTLTFPVSSGVHKVDLYWATNAGTTTANGLARNLLVEEA